MSGPGIPDAKAVADFFQRLAAARATRSGLAKEPQKKVQVHQLAREIRDAGPEVLALIHRVLHEIDAIKAEEAERLRGESKRFGRNTSKLGIRLAEILKGVRVDDGSQVIRLEKIEGDNRSLRLTAEYAAEEADILELVEKLHSNGFKIKQASLLGSWRGSVLQANPNLTDRTLEAIGPDCEELNICGEGETQYSDDGLKYLPGLKRLHSGVPDRMINDKALAFLPNLVYLSLNPEASVSNEGLVKCTKLRELRMHRGNSSITDEALKALVELEELTLGDRCRVTGSAFLDLPKLRIVIFDCREDNKTTITTRRRFRHFDTSVLESMRARNCLFSIPTDCIFD